jgi:hypothetical protein
LRIVGAVGAGLASAWLLWFAITVLFFNSDPHNPVWIFFGGFPVITGAVLWRLFRRPPREGRVAR